MRAFNEAENVHIQQVEINDQESWSKMNRITLHPMFGKYPMNITRLQAVVCDLTGWCIP